MRDMTPDELLSYWITTHRRKLGLPPANKEVPPAPTTKGTTKLPKEPTT